MLTFDEGDEPTVTDGPFTEAKELVGGFSILEVASREEAVTWARRAPLAPGRSSRCAGSSRRRTSRGSLRRRSWTPRRCCRADASGASAGRATGE